MEQPNDPISFVEYFHGLKKNEVPLVKEYLQQAHPEPKSLTQSLFDAVQENKRGITALLLKYGVSPNEFHSQYLQKTPLLQAVENENVGLVRLLKAYNASERQVNTLRPYNLYDPEEKITAVLRASQKYKNADDANKNRLKELFDAVKTSPQVLAELRRANETQTELVPHNSVEAVCFSNHEAVVQFLRPERFKDEAERKEMANTLFSEAIRLVRPNIQILRTLHAAGAQLSEYDAMYVCNSLNTRALSCLFALGIDLKKFSYQGKRMAEYAREVKWCSGEQEVHEQKRARLLKYLEDAPVDTSTITSEL